MVQIKIYSLKDHLAPLKEQFSDVLHACAVEALHLPPEKRFHRFIVQFIDQGKRAPQILP